jgi:hypothetical protein
VFVIDGEHEMDIRRLLTEIRKLFFPKTVISGKHEAEGIGVVTGIDASRSVQMKPDTVARASGVGKITATKIQ